MKMAIQLKTQSIQKISLFATLMFANLPVWAAQGPPHPGPTPPPQRVVCHSALSPSGKPKGHNVGPIQLIPSGRDWDVYPDLKKAAQIIFGKGGVAEKLGYSLPPHVIEFMPAGELTLMASVGHHPIPHFYDGSQLMNAFRSAGGVLEFVTPGCPACRSFYSDTTHLEHQISVLLHVAGHNDFSENSLYSRTRPMDPIAASLELAQYMQELYQRYDHDEVSLFYQHLLTLKYHQDLIRGTFEDPDQFRPELKSGASGQRIVHTKAGQTQNVYPTPERPTNPTKSMLQALVHNLPADAPEWKRKMAELFEKVFRVYGYYAQDKIMNEGWATLSQELLAKHSPWTSSHYGIEFGNLMAGVAYPRLSNPYWLGRECWKALYRRFLERSDVKGQSELEIDRRFVAYAHHLMQSVANDYDFIRLALDEQWVTSHNLVLERKSVQEEVMARNPGRPDPRLQNPEPKTLLTRHWKRVVNKIARRFADKRFQIPDLQLRSFNGFGRGVVRYEHVPFLNIPIKRRSIAQTLFVLTQIWGKSVSLETVFPSAWVSPPPPLPSPGFPPFPRFGGMPTWAGGSPVALSQTFRSGPPPKAMPRFVPVRIEVDASGKAQVFRKEENPEDKSAPAQEILVEGLSARMTDWIAEYREDSEISYNTDLTSSERERYAPALAHAVEKNMERASRFVPHSPTTAHALLEYHRLVERRLLQQLKRALTGQIKTRKTRTGMRFRVLPLIPEFEFDSALSEQILEELPPAPVDQIVTAPKISSPYVRNATEEAPSPADDDNSDIGQRPGGDPGDTYWGTGKPDGQGSGRSEDDEDAEQEQQEGDEPDHGAEGDAMDPNEVEIPIELYGKLLHEQLGLKNMRRVEGENDEIERVREGATHRQSGDTLYHRMIGAAIVKGRIAKSQQALDAAKGTTNSVATPRIGGPLRAADVAKMAKEGFKHLTPQDHVVRDHEEVPQPEMNAVIVFVMDMTGSMQGKPVQAEQELVFNAKALLQAAYKNVKIHYVGYDDVAHEFPESKVFRTFLGGGNTDSTGYVMAKKILDKYPTAQWNKYVIGMGDGASNDGAATLKAIEELLPDTQYMGFAQISAPNDWGFPAFVNPLKELAKKSKWFGYANVDGSQRSIFGALKEFFGAGTQP